MFDFLSSPMNNERDGERKGPSCVCMCNQHKGCEKKATEKERRRRRKKTRVALARLHCFGDHHHSDAYDRHRRQRNERKRKDDEEEEKNSYGGGSQSSKIDLVSVYNRGYARHPRD